MPANKTSNEYAEMITIYESMPKAVLAALAVSLVMRVNGSTTPKEVTDELINEWEALYDNGIIPQKPPKH